MRHNLNQNKNKSCRTAQFHVQYIPIQVVKLQHKYKNKDHFNEIRPDYSCDPSTKQDQLYKHQLQLDLQNNSCTITIYKIHFSSIQQMAGPGGLTSTSLTILPQPKLAQSSSTVRTFPARKRQFWSSQFEETGVTALHDIHQVTFLKT